MNENPFATSSLPPMVRSLLIANGLVFLVQQIMASQAGLSPMIRYFALWPLGIPDVVPTPQGLVDLPGFAPWQLLTYGFLHGGIMHLFVNMFGLWMFGRIVEQVWGQNRFLIYYLVCVVGAGLTQLVAVSFFGSGQIHPTIGASGGLFGILLAFGMLFPNARVMLLIPPIPMKAKWLVIGYGALQLFFGVTGTLSGIAHFAHLGGMLFGFFLIRYWQGRAPFNKQ